MFRQVVHRPATGPGTSPTSGARQQGGIFVQTDFPVVQATPRPTSQVGGPPVAFPPAPQLTAYVPVKFPYAQVAVVRFIQNQAVGNNSEQIAFPLSPRQAAGRSTATQYWNQHRTFSISTGVVLPEAVDIAALDSGIAANAILRQTRRTDVKLGPQTLRIHPAKRPQPVPEIDHATERQLAVARIRDMRLEALWLSGAIDDDEYFALRLAA